jgi:hypothetical protein
MLRPAPIHASQEARAYLESHGVPDAISTAVAGILKDRPEEPVTAIAKAMLAAEESVRKRNLHPFAAVPVAARRHRHRLILPPASQPPPRAVFVQRKEAKMLGEIALMTGPSGFEYIIVCCSNLAAENYWQKRLATTIKEVTGASGVVLCVHEDWNGGAGNGLGTLYAFQKACAKAKEMDGTDLAQKMRDGAAVALYHTAGKGTRMAPLPGAENNNKPGVKLPSLIDVGGEASPITVLECVMRQTSSYAAVRKGRCSVFWGDQIFVPSCGIQESNKPADILAALRPMPTKAEWEAEELHQYGLIAVDTKGSATQLEKVSYETAVAYLPSDVQKVGTSLGSFSLSAALMDALTAEFATELEGKTASLDSDPHFWMPMTLKKADYQAVMSKKGVSAEESDTHYDRMAAFTKKFQPGGGALLGCVDVGTAAYWWDYGRLGLYFENNLLLGQTSASAHALRTFLGLHPYRQQESKLGSDMSVDESSVLLGCQVASGKIGKGCILVNVVAPAVELEGCILMNVTSDVPITGKGGLLYNVVHEAGGSGTLECNRVRADVFMPDSHLKMMSAEDIDGGKVWKTVVENNPFSFEDVYKKNQKLDVGECTALAKSAHAAARAKMK